MGNKELFQELINGLFQAEGNIYYEFNSLNSEQGKFKWSISLNASEGSIKLFKRLNNIFFNKLKYNIFYTENDKVHVRIYTKDLDLIINKIKPYLNNIYGDKYRCIVYLMKIKYILDILKKTNYKVSASTLCEKDENKKYIDLIIKLIYLVYNMVDNSQRKITLEQKLELVLSKYTTVSQVVGINQDNYNNYYKSNIDYYNNYLLTVLQHNPNKKFNINYKWLLGFFLGDGNILIYIRNNKNLTIWLIYMLRISQKITEDNVKLLNLIKEYLSKEEIKLDLKYEGDKIEINISDKKSLQKLLKEWIEYSDNWYNKKLDLFYLEKILVIWKLARYWKYGLLTRIYMLKKYKNLKYKNLSNRPQGVQDSKKSLKLLSIEEIIKDLKEILLLNIKTLTITSGVMGSVEEQKNFFNNIIDINYIISRLIKDKVSGKYYYFYYGNDTTKLLLYTRYYYFLIKKYSLEDIDDLKFIFNYKNLGYVVKLPIKIKPKEKYFFFSKYGENLALLNSKIYKYTHLINWLKNNIFNSKH